MFLELLWKATWNAVGKITNWNNMNLLKLWTLLHNLHQPQTNHYELSTFIFSAHPGNVRSSYLCSRSMFNQIYWSPIPWHNTTRPHLVPGKILSKTWICCEKKAGKLQLIVQWYFARLRQWGDGYRSSKKISTVLLEHKDPFNVQLSSLTIYRLQVS